MIENKLQTISKRETLENVGGCILSIEERYCCGCHLKIHLTSAARSKCKTLKFAACVNQTKVYRYLNKGNGNSYILSGCLGDPY